GPPSVAETLATPRWSVVATPTGWPSSENATGSPGTGCPLPSTSCADRLTWLPISPEVAPVFEIDVALRLDCELTMGTTANFTLFAYWSPTLVGPDVGTAQMY